MDINDIISKGLKIVNSIGAPSNKKKTVTTTVSPVSSSLNTNTAKTTYQQNVAKPISTTPATTTTRGTLGKLMNISQQNAFRGAVLTAQFAELQQTPSSKYYNPYTQATNRAVSNLASMGIDTSKIDDDWFEQTKWLDDYLIYNGTTNTPSSPGKKATAEQNAAYERYQIQKQRDLTNKAKTEWAALQEEVTFLTKREDLNYSDDDVIDYVYSHDFAKKYPTLAQMDESLSGNGTAILELNESIDYNKDNLYGVIWAARNGDTSGNTWINTARSALGEGNVWKEDPNITAKLDVNNKETYSPYSVGSTLTDELVYFNKPSFTHEEVIALESQVDKRDATALKNFNTVWEAEETTVELETELDKMNQQIDYLISNWYDNPKAIIDAIKNNKDYNELFALDKTLTNNNLVKTTRAIDYRWKDKEQYILNKCAELSGNDVPMTDLSGQIIDIASGANKPVTVPQGAASTQLPVNTQAPAAQTTPASTPADVNAGTPLTADQIVRVNVNGKEVLLATVSNGIPMTTEEALHKYYVTGQSLGEFATVEEADNYKGQLIAKQVAEEPNAPASAAQPGLTPEVDLAKATPTATPTATPMVTPGPVNTANPQAIATQSAAPTQSVAPTQAPVNTPAPKTTEQLQEEAEQKNLSTVAPTILDKGTDAEKLVFQTARSTIFGAVAGSIATAQISREAAIDATADMMDAKAIDTYLPSLKTIRGYSAVQEEKASLEAELTQTNRAITSYEARDRIYNNLTTGDISQINTLEENGDAEQIRKLLQGDDGDKFLAYKAIYERGYVDGYDQPSFDQAWAEVNGTSTYSTEGMDAFIEAHPKIQTFEDALLNGVESVESSVEQLTDDDYDNWEQQERNREYLTNRIQQLDTYLTENKQAYDDAIKTRDSMTQEFDDFRTLTGENDPTLMKLVVWENAISKDTPYDFSSKTPYQRAMEDGATAAELQYGAASVFTADTTEIDYLRSMLEDPYSLGLNPTNQDIERAKQRLVVLDKERNQAARFMITQTPSFTKIADEQKAKGESESYSDTTNANISILLGENVHSAGVEWASMYVNGEAHKHIGTALNRAKEYAAVMTQDEKDMYFWYLSQKGEDAANFYLKDLVNETNGMIMSRAQEAREEKIDADIQKGGAGAFFSWIGAFGTKALGNVQSTLNSWYYGIKREKNYDPNGVSFQLSNDTDTVRESVNKYITSQVGEENGKALTFFMNAINSAGDSTINAIATSGALNAIGKTIPAVGKFMDFLETAQSGQYGKVVKFTAKAVDDWAHAVPMAYFASGDAYRNAIASGASHTQAEQIAAATFWAESVTEAITVGNIRDMWGKGASGEVKGFIKDLFKNGLEEAVGEGVGEWWESKADREIMGALSKYDQNVDAMVAAGIPRAQAEEMANQQVLKDILISAASGFVSSGFSSSGSYMVGSFKGAKASIAQENMVNADIAKLTAAEKTQNGKNSAISISAILRNNSLTPKGQSVDVIKGTFNADAAASHFVGNVNNGSGANAISAAKSILSKAGSSVLEVKEAMTYGSMTNGLTNRTLKGICEKVSQGIRVTEGDVNELLVSMKGDKTGDNAAKNILDINKNVTEYRKAVREAALLASTRSDVAQAIKTAQDAVDTARANVEVEQSRKETADAKVEAAKETAKAAAQQQIENPTKEGNGPVQQSMNELEGAVNAQKAAEETLTQTEEKLEKEEENLETVRDQKMQEVRQEASESVEQEMQQEEVVAAEEAQQAHDAAVQAVAPVLDFGHRIETTDSNGNTVRLTGIYDFFGDTVIYSTEDGRLVMEDPGPNLNTSGYDQFRTDNYTPPDGSVNTSDNAEVRGFVDQMFDRNANQQRAAIHPEVYFPVSIPVTINGQEVQMIGISGKETVDGMENPVIMGIDGTEYSTEDEGIEIPFEYRDTVDDLFDANADNLQNKTDIPRVQTTEEAVSSDNGQRSEETGQTGESVPGTGTEGNNPGQLPLASGRNDGFGDNGNVGSDGGQEGNGGTAEGTTESDGSAVRGDASRLLGKTTVKTLKDKGVTDLKLNIEADPQRFSSDLDAAKSNNKHGLFVDAQSVEELENKGAIMILSENGLAGAAVGTKGSDAGNIFAVFKNARSRARKASVSLIIQAVAQGGNKLDCYDGGLRGMYSSVGMVPVATIPFSEEYHQDDGWNYERDGKPDIVVWMLKPGETAETIAQKYKLAESEGGFHRYSDEEMAQLPTFHDVVCPDVLDEEGNPLEYGYDIALRFRDNMLEGKYPENFAAYPEGAIVLTDQTNNRDVTVVGASITDDGVNYVSLNGEVIPSTNFNGGTNNNDSNPDNAAFENWATQQAENALNADTIVDTTGTPETSTQTPTRSQNKGIQRAVFSMDDNGMVHVEKSKNQRETGINTNKNTTDTPTETQTKKVKTKLKSPQEIVTNLAKAIGVQMYGTNKFGNMANAIRGFFDPHGDYTAVRNRELGNASVTFHETGHAIANMLGLRGTDAMVESLRTARQNGENNIDLNSYSPEQLRDEAFAEFFRNYMTGDQAARAFAGDAFVDEFEQRLLKQPKLYKAVKEAQEQYQMFQQADADQRLEALVKYERSGERKSFSQILTHILSGLTDRSAAAEDIVKFVRDSNGGKLDFSENLRAMSLLSNHSQKQAVYMLKDNLISPDGTIIGDGLGKMMEKVGFKGTEENIHLLERYTLAMHALDRAREGKPVFDQYSMSEADCRQVISDVRSTRQDIVDAEKVWQAFRHNFLKTWMVDTGYMSNELLNRFERMYPHYAPTFRVGGVSSMQGVGGNTGKGYTLREAVGGTQDIYSPFYSFVGMVDSVTSMVNQNRVARTFDKLYQEYEGLGAWARPVHGPAQVNDRAMVQEQLTRILEGNVDADIMEQVLEATSNIPNRRENDAAAHVLHVQREDGSVARYEFSEDGAELYKLLAGVQDRTNIKVLNAIGALTRTMSMLTTGSNPLFAARNAVRDFQTSVNYGSWASNYLTGAAKWMKTLVEVWNGKSDALQSYYALGGGGWTRIDQNNRQSMNDIQSDIFGDDKSTVGKTAKWLGKKLWNTITLEHLNEVIEQTSRFAEYKYGKHDLSTAEGRQEAFLAAQDVTVDFSRSGNNEAATVLKKLVPFFNASMQGVYRTGRQFSESERGRVGARLAKTVVNTALMSALASGLILKFGDDDDKEEFANILSSGIKANHLILPNPFKGEADDQPPFIRIPLGQDPVMYAVHNMVTNAMWSGSSDEYAITLAATADVILDNMNPLGSGTIMQPIIDASHNTTWYGSKLIRSNMEDWTDPSSQYNEDTPVAFRWLGNLLNTSPEVLEYYFTQYTGFAGSLAIPAMTYDNNGNIGGLNAVWNSFKKKWTADPYSSNEATNNFYDMVNDLNTIKDEAKNGRPEGLLLRSLTQEDVNQAYLEAEEMLGSGGLVTETKNSINELYKEIDKINSNENLTDKEKYKLVREQKQEMVKLVESANEQLLSYRKKYITGETLMDKTIGETMKRLTFGKTAQIPTDAERIHQTFKDDADQPYMQMTMGLYDDISAMNENERKAATGSNTDPKSLLPNPTYKFTIKNSLDVENEYEIPEEDRERYDVVYKNAYSNYLIANSAGWEVKSYKEKRQLISNARSAGNKAIKEQYVYEHPEAMYPTPKVENGSSSRVDPNSLMASAGISDVGARSRSTIPQRPASENNWGQYMEDLDDYWANYDFNKNDPTGRYGKGNIDLNNRIVVNNPDGSISTDLSFSFYDEDVGKEVLIPQVVNGRIVSEEEAKEHYYETGENFGMFDTWQDADEYAMMLHNRNNWFYRR